MPGEKVSSRMFLCNARGKKKGRDSEVPDLQKEKKMGVRELQCM